MYKTAKDNPTTRYTNILLPIWLIDHIKLVAIAKSYESQHLYRWTDLVRETLLTRFPLHVCQETQKQPTKEMK